MVALSHQIIFLFNIYQAYSLGFFGFGQAYKDLRIILSADTFAQPANIQTRWIEQPLDHFNDSNRQSWQMRYFERLDLWRPNGPIYLFIGGEGEAHPGFLRGGLIYDLAKETNGAMIMSEHRYYGKSMPLDNSKVENLKFLSAKQALADIENLLKTFKRLPHLKNSKIVAIGGSYPGNLAAWLKVLYPDLIDAALASSAPVLAKKDYFEYLETVGDDYEQYGTPGCYDYIVEMFKSYEEAYKTQAGIEKLKKDENICEESDMNRKENQDLFAEYKADRFLYTAQYGNENRIRSHCERLMNSSTRHIDDHKLYFDEIKWIKISDQKRKCLDIDYDAGIEEIKQGGWITSWVWQICTEFSYAITTSSDAQPFSKHMPIENFYKMCSLSFGPDYNEQTLEKAVADTNKLFGGLSPNVTKVFFANGELDPWHRLGVLEDVSYEAPAKMIPRSSHCMDLYPNRAGDLEELVETRAYIKYLLKSWIGFES